MSLFLHSALPTLLVLGLSGRGDKDIFTVAVSKMDNGNLVEKGLFRYDHASNRLRKQHSPPKPDFEPPLEWAAAH